MDNYMFREHVSECRQVSEKTHYVEIFNYSDPLYDSSEEHPLTMDEFDNFLYRRGAFEPARMKEGVKLLNGVRLILQKNAEHADTFAGHTISFTAEAYESMVRAMRLPLKAVEGTNIVGPFFWCAYDQDDEDPTLQIIFRKSDVRKKGKTRGWEIMLSHCFSNGITSGYVKGTPSSNIVLAIRQLEHCVQQVVHPMLLPIIILSHELSSQNDLKQREARDWLRKLEHAISMRNDIERDEYIDGEGYLEVEAISRDLGELHGQVLWKRPQAYLEIIKEMEAGMDRFKVKLPQENRSPVLDKLHRSLVSRLDFYRLKLKGIEVYQATTIERLNIQRGADSTAMKAIALLGALFLPGTFVASVFSMSFFDFGRDANPAISQQLWVYFAISIPLTIVIVCGWVMFDRRRKEWFASEEVDVEKSIEHMRMGVMTISWSQQ
ncbi:uncharacterized protein ColSpa_06183 [Colletotrichum spaethianum]|uniref:CorA-like Mg2+ transporter n=1 Tax=Colletotrichum spaethianum TaxID=700344 RepID=A0AA37LKJ2_9PEZI|nr:uncharacterized protein ColSpa_06183 [Colletotrichum spaethianum]GKT46002.1 hypothetical protein ColSpa_06183 [Colletotrichum spaethianum]